MKSKSKFLGIYVFVYFFFHYFFKKTKLQELKRNVKKVRVKSIKSIRIKFEMYTKT